MGIFETIANIIAPISKTIDNVSTTDEERLKLRNELQKIQSELHTKFIEYETQLLEAQKSVLLAESTGKSWLQRNWRPITMLTFLVLVVLESLNLLNTTLNQEAWYLLKIGLGGYVIGRSAEKIVPQIGRNRTDSAKG